MKLQNPLYAHSQLAGILSDDHHHSESLPLSDLGGVQWVLPGWFFENITTQAITQNILWYIPIYVEREKTYTRVGLHVQGAGAGGAEQRIGLYTASISATGQLSPDALVDDAGKVVGDVTGEKTLTVSWTLAKGFHFLAYSANSTPALYVPDTAKALKAPVETVATAVANSPVCILRAAHAGVAALADPAPAPTAYSNSAYAALKVRV